MISSDILVNALKQFEGCRLTAYKPVKTEKYWTIGYGHYGADVKQGMKISEQTAEEYLRKDLHRFESAVNNLNVCKTQGQFDALVDFSYNLGFANLASSTLLKKIKAKAPLAEIQAQFLRWNRSNGKVLAGLTKRRQWEAKRWSE